MFRLISIYRDDYLQFSGNGDQFKIQLAPFPETVKNYFVETARAAEEIHDLKQGDLHVMYSGGRDSEYALSVFLKLGIPVIPTVVSIGPYNQHDLSYAQAFCAQHKLTPKIIDIDFDQFVSSGKILETAVAMQSNVYHYSVLAHAVSQLDGTVICCDNEPYIKQYSDGWNIEMYEYDFAIPRHFINQGILGTPHFNIYTAEMMMAYLLDSQMQSLARNEIPGKQGSHSSKHIVYNRHSDLFIRARSKRHGYEEMEQQEIFKHPVFAEFDKLRETWNGTYSVPYFEFLQKQNTRLVA